MKPNTALCIIGALCVIIGAIIAWLLCDFCSKHFPKPTPDDPPAPSLSNVVQSAWFIQPQTASQPEAYPQSISGPCDCGCSFDFTLLVTNGQMFLLKGFVPTEEAQVVFLQQLDTIGITNVTVTSHPLNIVQDGADFAVLGDNMVTVVIERSGDLQQWEPIRTNSFPAGMQLMSTVDGPCSNAFYRVRQ